MSMRDKIYWTLHAGKEKLYHIAQASFHALPPLIYFLDAEDLFILI